MWHNPTLYLFCFCDNRRDGEEWYRIRKSIAPKIMLPEIIEENIDNFNAVTKDTVARFVQLNKDCGPNDHIPDLEGELHKWSTESKLLVSYGLKWTNYN